jgi:hypothetical protein
MRIEYEKVERLTQQRELMHRAHAVEISKPFTRGRLNIEVVLHECAHILAGPEAGHGPAFVKELDRLLQDHAEACIGWVEAGWAVIVR